jgi:hypothetical protein
MAYNGTEVEAFLHIFIPGKSEVQAYSVRTLNSCTQNSASPSSKNRKKITPACLPEKQTTGELGPEAGNSDKEYRVVEHLRFLSFFANSPKQQ